MKSKIFSIVFCFFCVVGNAQSKWDQDLEVDYRMTDKDESLLNHIIVKKDSVFYEWIDKNKRTIKKAANDIDLQNKLLKAMSDNKLLKFKSGKLVKGSINIVLTHSKGHKTKIIIFPQPIKQGSREEKFVKEFMEPIFKKMFEHDLKNFPK